MTVHGKLTGAALAAVLALGLAACGGGGGGSGGGGGGSGTPGPGATERATALAAALEAARPVGADGTFDDTPYMVAPAVTASDDGTGTTIGVTETGTPQGGAARSGDFTAEKPDPAAIAGWTGARLARGETERLMVYADVAVPEAMAFVPDNLNRLREVSGLSGDTVPASGLPVQGAWHPVIRSTSLAAAPAGGRIEYNAQGTGADAGLAFAGTFGGGAGGYECSGSACSVTLDDRGAPAAMAGTWFFKPAAGARVMVPDYDHLYFGWWLHGEDPGPYGFQSFAGAAGYAPGAGNVTAAMEGSATYRGAAAGVWTTMSVSGGEITSARSGEFTADATLRANFFGAKDEGVVNGEIAAFRDGNGRSMAGWRVTLDSAPLTAGSASFSGAAEGTLGGDSVSTGGSWEGAFHGSDGAAANPRPGHVTGRFDARFPGASIAGAFGASR